MARLVVAVDVRSCIGCRTCVVACQMAHRLYPGEAWLAVDELEQGRWPNATRAMLTHSCMHCDEAPCTEVCPTGASAKHPDGTVQVAADLCVGCGLCVASCPYGARTIAHDEGFFFGAASPAPYEDPDRAHAGTAWKCTLCRDLPKSDPLRAGTPACVAACPAEARMAGDLDDPDDPVHDYIRDHGCLRVEGTSAYYTALPDGFENPDADAALRAVGARARKAASAQDAPAPGANPAVITGAAAAGVVAIGAAGARARANAVRRRASGNVNESVNGNESAGMPAEGRG